MLENWNECSRGVLKSKLAKHNVKLKDLVIALRAIGVEETYSSVSSKINRGTFSFVFFLQCIHALRIKNINISLDDIILNDK